jgi:fructose-1,6-bisphosphatase/inositol monophosphatase family enzyme
MAPLAEGRGLSPALRRRAGDGQPRLICAGSLLVEHAGGRVTGLDGAPLVFNQPSPLRPGVIASNGLLHQELLRLIAEVAP